MQIVSERREIVPSPVLGMLIFIGTEVMFFCGLISSYLVIRAGVAFWPPPDQPRLPVEATAFNSLVLLASGVAIYQAGKVFADPFRKRLARRLISLTLLLGTFFVLFQGYEWTRLIGYGLTLSDSLYGALFYVIIGAHALHVTAALLFLLWIRLCFRRRAGSAHAKGLDPDVFTAARMFWYFVIGVWPVLYGLVYLY